MLPSTISCVTERQYQDLLREVAQARLIDRAQSSPQERAGNHQRARTLHRRMLLLSGGLGLLVLTAMGSGDLAASAQDATPTSSMHPFVGTWIVDTISASDNDSPEIAVVTADGGVIGQGANRAAGGRWQAIDEQTVELTLVSVYENEGVGRYTIVRGPHTVDETGDAWTCECTFTVVSADGTVLDSGSAPASGRRLPLQGMDLVGQPLAEVPIWVPFQPEATPTP
jgi:hypothetical protein